MAGSIFDAAVRELPGGEIIGKYGNLTNSGSRSDATLKTRAWQLLNRGGEQLRDPGTCLGVTYPRLSPVFGTASILA